MFKKRCRISRIGLFGFNKSFLNAAVGTPVGTHNIIRLRHTHLFKDISKGNAIPNKHIELDNFGIVYLVTVVDKPSPNLLGFLRRMTIK